MSHFSQTVAFKMCSLRDICSRRVMCDLLSGRILVLSIQPLCIMHEMHYILPKYFTNCPGTQTFVGMLPKIPGGHNFILNLDETKVVYCQIGQSDWGLKS